MKAIPYNLPPQPEINHIAGAIIYLVCIVICSIFVWSLYKNRGK